MRNVVEPYLYARFGNGTIRKPRFRAASVLFSEEIRHSGVLKDIRLLCVKFAWTSYSSQL